MYLRHAALYAAELLVVCLVTLAPAAALAQARLSLGSASASAVRIEPSQAPSIDADLSDPAWANATVIDDFRQREPTPGAPATERTVVRVMYDENNLYFGVYAYDSMPDQIAVRAMSRDGALFTGDLITITLDPGLTRRNAYGFDVGPSGGRGDALYLNNSQDLSEWDAIWQARARVVSDGWVAEIAIPFQSLSYGAGEGDWGLEISRLIRRKNEQVRWASTNPALDRVDVSEEGTLSGIGNVNQGIGLDVQVYGSLRAKRDWHIEGEDTGISFTAGGNAFYKITPALTGTLTIHPDFSDAPLDVRQVNRSRFSLFFPETRDFFLQDAGAFEFGGQNFAGNDRVTNNGRPFFSRNLGLVDGTPVSIIAGGKVSGEYGGFNVGALSVYTDRTAEQPGQLLSVLRVTRPVLQQSRIGFVVTNGDPTGETKNTVAGADFQYRSSNFLDGNTLVADIFYQRSFSDVHGEDASFGGMLEFPNEPWSGEIGFKQIGAAFAPALGFVNRTAIRAYDASIQYLHRFDGGYLRTMDFSAESQIVTDLNGRVETREHQFSIGFETDPGEEFEADVTNYHELVPAPFDVADTIIIPAGKYEWTNVSLSLETSEGRRVAFDAEVACCSFYNGRGVEASFELNFRPNQYFEIAPSYEVAFYDLPGGEVDVHVLAADGVVNFTPDMQLAMQVQYDNISESFGFLARYRWEYLPGSELFVALGQSARIPNSRFMMQRTQLSIRLGHTLRF